MPIQIKLGTVQNIAANIATGTTAVAEDKNQLFIADNGNKARTASEFHAGPHQPLANTKMWFDTIANKMKINNGKEWVVATTEETKSEDFGSWDPGPMIYTGLTQEFSMIGYEPVSDVLSATVALTRTNGWLFNTLIDSDYDTITPTNTEWAFPDKQGNPSVLSALNYASLIFKPFNAAAESSMPNSLNTICVCHLIDSDIYFEAKFIQWNTCDEPDAGMYTMQRSSFSGSAAGSPIGTTPYRLQI
jgi:hypothetical protein